MKSLWEASTRNELQDRLERLTEHCERRWGRMSAPQMMAHLVDAMRMATGDIRIPSKNLPIRFTPLKQLIIYWLPFPKGAPTAPQLISRPPADWPSEHATLATLIDHVAEQRDRAGDWPEHPAFGKLNRKQWGVLLYRHIDHHFRQFGV